MVLSSRGLGHHPFTVVTGVRIPLGLPYISQLSLTRKVEWGVEVERTGPDCLYTYTPRYQLAYIWYKFLALVQRIEHRASTSRMWVRFLHAGPGYSESIQSKADW